MGVQIQQTHSSTNQHTKELQEMKNLQKLNQAAIRDLHHLKSNLRIERTTDWVVDQNSRMESKINKEEILKAMVKVKKYNTKLRRFQEKIADSSGKPS